MTDNEEKDLLTLLHHLTTMVQIRNAATVQARQGPLEDRKDWRKLYQRCVTEIQETESEISSILPSHKFERKGFISFM